MPVSPPIAVTELHRSAILRVVDYRCAAGPGTRAEPEQHTHHGIAYVRRGAFGCRCRGQAVELVAGSLFVGSPGDEYLCSHDHHPLGDQCLSFRFEPALVEEIGADPAAWRVVAVPPIAAFVVLGELAQACARGHGDLGLDEVGVWLARRLVDQLAAPARRSTPPSARDRQRALRAALWIEANATEPVTLDQVAAEAGCSSFHFLRVFARAFGITPHQYLIRRRLAHAARLLAEEALPVTSIAFEVGFGDLSNFVRSFGQAVGLTPTEFRRLAKGERQRLSERLGTALQ